MKYRADIDGLRAVAILAVLFYHVGIGPRGGFVGVDVFFVISGYLITGLILKDLDRDRFHIVEFWQRRIRRILPALVVVVAASLIAGWRLLIPVHFEEMGESVVAQAMLVSNIFFWRKSGYFAAGVELKPLFHTWSLAVEEQFYLLFPFLLIGLHRISRKLLAPALILVCAGSLILSVYCSYFHDLADFYLLPMRAWELLLGALLAVIPAQESSRRWVRESAGSIGLIMIAYAVFMFNRSTRFPGAAALLPCVGAALIIRANSHHRGIVGRILATPPMVFIGLISYSLYLWHWPVLVFSQYGSFAQPSARQAVVIMMASAVLATLSWLIVETPFRKRMILKSRAAVFSFAAVSLSGLLVAGLAIEAKQGVPSRLSAQAQRFANARRDRAFVEDVSLDEALQDHFLELGIGDKTQPVELVLWGDSHAMAISPLVDLLCKEYAVRGVGAVHASTAPLVGYESRSAYALMEKSIPFNDAVVAFIRQKHVPDVLLVCSWGGAADFDRGTEKLRQGMIDTVAALRGSGSRLWVMKSVPNQPWDVPNALVSAVLAGRDPESLGATLEYHRQIYDRLDPIFKGIDAPGVTVLDPTSLFLAADGHCRTAEDGYALYFDSHHLTIHGAMLVRPLLEPIFRGRSLSH